MCLVGLIVVHCHSPFKSSVRSSPKWGEGKITHSKTPQWGRGIGRESLAAHFVSFASLGDAHVQTNKQTNKHPRWITVKKVQQGKKKPIIRKIYFHSLIFSYEFRIAQQCSFSSCICLFISNMCPRPCNSAGALPVTGSLFRPHKAHLLCESYFCLPVLIVYYKLCCSQWLDIKLIFNSSLASSLRDKSSFPFISW